MASRIHAAQVALAKPAAAHSDPTTGPQLIVGPNAGGQGHLRLYERFIVKQSRSLRELGVRADEDLEAVADTVGDVWR